MPEKSLQMSGGRREEGLEQPDSAQGRRLMSPLRSQAGRVNSAHQLNC